MNMDYLGCPSYISSGIKIGGKAIDIVGAIFLVNLFEDTQLGKAEEAQGSATSDHRKLANMLGDDVIIG